MDWFPVTYILANLITNSIHEWLTKYSRLAGMYIVRSYRVVIVVANIVTRRTSKA